MSLEHNRGNNNCIPPSGIGYIVIPLDCDVQQYIARCYRTCTVSISGGYDSTYMHNVRITIEALNQIVFPSAVGELGSPVVWLRVSFSNRPVVIGVLNTVGTSNMTAGHQQQVVQQTEGQTTQLMLDAVNSSIDLSSVGTSSTPARITVKAVSEAAGGDAVNVVSKDILKLSSNTLNVNLIQDLHLLINRGYINGEQKDILNINITEEQVDLTDHWGNTFKLTTEQTDEDEAEQDNSDTTIKPQLDVTTCWGDTKVVTAEQYSITDHWGNTFTVNEDEIRLKDHLGNEIILNQDNAQILTNKFNVGTGAEPMVLGNTLVSLLGSILDGITAITVTTPHGVSGTPLNASTFSSIKSKLDTLLSQLSNTD